MSSKLNLNSEAARLPYELKKYYLLKQPETTIHKLLFSLINKLGDNYSAEITHGSDEHGRDLVVKQKDELGNQYIGVIVKKGNPKGELTGKTAGEIDEILSQARQAMSHPCLLHELGAGTVRINQLWIFFVGRLTDTASVRIEVELKDVSKRIFSLQEIIELFANYYPEVFFDSVLAEFVEASITKVESLSLTADKPKLFKTKYINPRVSKWEKAIEITEALTNIIYTRKIPFQRLVDVISSGKRIILTGDPGVGKTTALIKIAGDMLRHNFVLKTKNRELVKLEVPILIKAKLLLQKTPDEIFGEFVASPELKEQIRVKTLLVDGLDEVDGGKWESCMRIATEFADKFKCGLVITCRKIPMITTVLSPFDRYELLPLEYEQAVAFVEQAIKDQQLIAALKDGIQRNELKMLLTPLALELLVEVATYEKEVPASLAEIFERYTDIICGKYDQSRGIDTIFEYHIKKKFLAEMAWDEFYQKGLLDVARGSFDVFLKNYSKKYGWDQGSLKRFVAEMERSGLLRIDDDKVSFSHRSFLDFFVALRISERRTEYPKLNQDIVSIYFDGFWSDVAFFYIGIQREINSEIIMGIDEYGVDDFYAFVFKMLVGRLIQAGWHTPSEEKVKAIEMGLKNVENIRKYIDEQLSATKAKLPTIFSDFFYMALSDYSFGSRTMLVETNSVCDTLIESCDFQSLRNCLLLLWAQRSRLPDDEKSKRGLQILSALSRLEKEGKLLARDKFVSLFLLEQIEKENKELLKSIRRKINRTKELYPGEMQKLLPAPKGPIRFSIRGKRNIS